MTMNGPILLLVLAAVVSSFHETNSVPMNWHKIAKREIQSAPADAEIKNDTQHEDSHETDFNHETSQEDVKLENENDDDLLEMKPVLDPMYVESPQLSQEPAQSDSSADRSIDWQLLSGKPEDLEREMEKRRRRRSVRPSSLSRQHRIRTLGRPRRSKRNAGVDPSDLLAAYEYLQARNQEVSDPRISLLDDDGGDMVGNASPLLYELQQPTDGRVEEDEEDQQVLPAAGYQPVMYEPEIRITPDQLAALELALSEQDPNQYEDEYYPKDKRSFQEPVYGGDDGENEIDQLGDESVQPEAVYLIPAPTANEYVQYQLPYGYQQSPYNYYQIDADPRSYEGAGRIYDEELLRRRIASLVDQINQQRQLERRRR